MTRQIVGALGILTLLFLCSCSSVVQIERGQCGVSVKMGSPIAGVTGPGSIHKPFLGAVFKFQQSRTIAIKTAEGNILKFNVRVLDPVQFWKLSLGNFDALADSLENRIKSYKREEAISALLSELNTPRTGIQLTLIA